MQKLLGGVLMATGILIAGVSGLCSLGPLMAFARNGSFDLGSLEMVGLFGGIPFAIGSWLTWLGHRVVKGRSRLW